MWQLETMFGDVSNEMTPKKDYGVALLNYD